MLKTLRQLKQRGVLSINRRNADYILKYNPRKYYPLVDDKLKTKTLCQATGIAVPALYKIISTEHDIVDLEPFLANLTDFVIKPANGVGGDGIVVIIDQVRGFFRRSNGKLIKFQELAYHISSILSGLHSLGGHPDRAFIEYRVKIDPIFSHISYQGVPDIRIICFTGYPVMAMVRLPTRQSDGKANLHQGAVGAGVDIATGVTFGGVWLDHAIDFHPDTVNDIAGIVIPNWQDVLMIAANCYELTGLGYIGVDIVLDQAQGPLLLELNARPGLSIQIANRAGLLERLAVIENLPKAPVNPKQRVLRALELFGSLAHEI